MYSLWGSDTVLWVLVSLMPFGNTDYPFFVVTTKFACCELNLKKYFS